MAVGVEKMLYESQFIIFLFKIGRTIFKTLIFNMNILKLEQILKTSYKEA